MTTRRTLTYALLALFALYALYPVARILSVSLRPAGDATSLTSPSHAPAGTTTLDHYRTLFAQPGFTRWCLNSVLTALLVAAVGVTVGAAGAYPLRLQHRFPQPDGRSRRSSPGRGTARLLLPATLLLWPLYLALVSLQRVHSHAGLVLLYTVTVLPFCLWQMRRVYDDALPEGLEDAAALDGCGPGQTFFHVILPLAAPGLAVTALFAFLTAWNEHFLVTLLLRDTGRFAPPLGLASPTGNGSLPALGLSAAVLLVMSAPVVVVFLIASRSLVSGLTDGGRPRLRKPRRGDTPVAVVEAWRGHGQR